MKIRDLIEKLNNYNQESEVIIRFCLDNEDEIGYILQPVIVGLRSDDVAIYAEYTATKEDCDFIGQVDLKEAYLKGKESVSENEEKIQKAKEWIKGTIAFISQNCDLQDEDNKTALESLKTALICLEKVEE